MKVGILAGGHGTRLAEETEVKRELSEHTSINALLSALNQKQS